MKENYAEKAEKGDFDFFDDIKFWYLFIIIYAENKFELNKIKEI